MARPRRFTFAGDSCTFPAASLRGGSMVGVAQSVRAPDCGSGGRRFEPGRPPSRTWSGRARQRPWQPFRGTPLTRRGDFGTLKVCCASAEAPLAGSLPRRWREAGFAQARSGTLARERLRLSGPPEAHEMFDNRGHEKRAGPECRRALCLSGFAPLSDASRPIRATGSITQIPSKRIRSDPFCSPELFKLSITESLILAQDERWRRALYMQVERGPDA